MKHVSFGNARQRARRRVSTHRGKSGALVNCEATSHFLLIGREFTVNGFLLGLVTKDRKQSYSIKIQINKEPKREKKDSLPHGDHLLFLMFIVIHLCTFSKSVISHLQIKKEMEVRKFTETWTRWD